MCGVLFVSLFLSFLFFFRFVDFFTLLLSMSLSQFSQGGGGRVVEGVSDTKLGSSCLYLLLLLFLLPLTVMPAVAGLLLLLELLQVFGLEGTQHWVSELPVVLAVLIDQGHLWLAQDGQQVLVLACAGGPLGAAGVERR